MPTYPYTCKDCGYHFEQHQSFNDDTLTVCPECGGRLHKVYGSVGIVFKGSGFYRTDSRSHGNSSLASTPDSPKRASSSTDATAPAPKNSTSSPTSPASPSPATTSA